MKRPERWIAAFDTHGDMVCKHTLAAFREFSRYWKPTIRIGGGDHFDFRFLRAKASDGDRYESGQLDFQMGLDFLREFKPTAVCWGNHDQRVWDQLHHPNGNVKDVARSMIEEMEDAVKTAKVVVPYHKRKYIQVGDLKVIHGFTSGDSGLRQTASIYGRVLMGHVHKVETVCMPGLDPKEGYSSGCLARLDLGYNDRHQRTLQQGNGWAYGHVHPNGHTTIHLARKIGGVWYLPTEFRSIS